MPAVFEPMHPRSTVYCNCAPGPFLLWKPCSGLNYWSLNFYCSVQHICRRVTQTHCPQKAFLIRSFNRNFCFVSVSRRKCADWKQEPFKGFTHIYCRSISKSTLLHTVCASKCFFSWLVSLTATYLYVSNAKNGRYIFSYVYWINLTVMSFTL